MNGTDRQKKPMILHRSTFIALIRHTLPEERRYNHLGMGVSSQTLRVTQASADSAGRLSGSYKPPHMASDSRRLLSFSTDRKFHA